MPTGGKLSNAIPDRSGASGGVGGAALADAAPRLRDAGWAYALAILLLCAEWLVRRGRAMR
jgi:hypothetical protein